MIIIGLVEEVLLLALLPVEILVLSLPATGVRVVLFVVAVSVVLILSWDERIAILVELSRFLVRGIALILASVVLVPWHVTCIEVLLNIMCLIPSPYLINLRIKLIKDLLLVLDI